jgi:multidrug efflux pump subunit AcrB
MNRNRMNDLENKSSQRSSEFFKFTTTRPVAILMVVLGIAVFGWISYKQLPLNLMPDISYPSLTVRTEYLGTAPEEVETTVSRPIEQATGVVDNLVSINSISKAGQSDVILEFSWDTDMNQATADLREKLDQVYLPDEVKRPLILRYDPSLDPFMRLGLFGERSMFYMRYLAEEDIKRRLETIEGVAAVKVKGGLEEEIRVELNEQQLTLIGINIQQIRERLAQENINLAGGNLKEAQTEYLVRTLNEFKTVDEIAEVVVGNWNGREIKVKDIAKVERTNKDREIITRLNGKESVEIEIFKEADANIVSVAKAVSAVVFGTAEQQEYVKGLEEKKKKEEQNKAAGRSASGNDESGQLQNAQLTNFIACQLPQGVKIDKLSDQSVFIENSVNEVKSTAISGGLLAILVLFLFLRNIPATVIIGLSIPISVVATFAPMKLFDVSLNIMSLGGLALGIGMLVDNSIVVLESISRCREEGDNLIQATIRGVGEVGGAVFASTMTTVAVFFPIVFVQGVAGQVFGDMALTIVFSLLASLAVAMFLVPMLNSRDISKFTGGVRLGALTKNNILDFSKQENAAALLIDGKHDHSPGEKILNGFMIIVSTLKSLSGKIIFTFGIFIWALWKLTFLPLFLITNLPFFLFRPLGSFLRKNGFIKFSIPYRATLIRLAEDSKIFFVKNIEPIWPDFLKIKSIPVFYNDLDKSIAKVSAGGWIKKIMNVLLLPVRFIFYSGKFIFFLMLEYVFAIVHVTLVCVLIFIKGGGIVFKLAFATPLQLLFNGFNYTYKAMEDGQERLLRWSLNNRAKLIGGMSLLFVFTFFVVGPRLGSELIPEVHQGEFNVDLTLPVGTPAERTDERIIPVQDFIAAQEGVAKVATVVGVDKTESTNTDEGEHTAKLTVTLQRASSVLVTEERLIGQIRSHVSDYSGIQAKISRPTIFSFKTPIEVEIHGYNLQKLQAVASEIETRMKEIAGLFDVKANIQRGNPEVQIIYNRSLIARYGLNILEIAQIVRNKVRGDVATEFKEEDRRIDVLVRIREEDKETIADLRRMVINPGAAIPLPLEAVADIRINEGPSEIRRIEQQRAAVITANITGRDLRSVGEDIYQVLRTIQMPDDFTYDLAGQNKEMETSLNSLMLALGLAIFLVYIVMAAQFESLLHPFIIMFTIPLAFIGVVLVLYLLNIPLSIMVFLGGIILAGIVVNNAIVLVDYINQLRQRGMQKIEAILLAGRVRLRPILMTTLTTVLGLLPMALGLGDGAEIRTPMAITVIVGLATSTLLTLVVIPTVYVVLDRKK